MDWRSRREIASQTALEHCLSVLKNYYANDVALLRTVRQAETIRDAIYTTTNLKFDKNDNNDKSH